MHTAFRHFLFSILFSLLTVVGSGEIYVPNKSSLQQTEWYACSQNVQPISTSVHIDYKYVATPLKFVNLVSYFSPFTLAFLKKERHIASKTYQYQVAPTLIGHFFRLKTASTTSSDDDLPLIEFV